MSEQELSVEATGETVGEAKWAAVQELQRLAPGVDRDAIRFQVVSEGERGLLGVGTTPARVVAVAPAPAPRAQPSVGDGADTSPPPVPQDERAIAEGLLERTLAVLGLEGAVEVHEEGGEIVARVSTDDTGTLIGRHGQMLDALQLVANAIAHARVGEDRRRIVVDAAGYRDRRASALETLARRTAERVSATGQPVMLDPMSAAERRLVHEALKDDPEVETASEGAEPYRSVVVLPRRADV